MLKVGITGGIGSGKTVICRLFSILGIPVYDSDFRAKWVMQHDGGLQEELIKTFGAETYTPAGQINRPYLANLVFNQPEKLAQLNGLVHPRVKADFTHWLAAQEKVPYIFKEAALMFESQAYKQVDKVITISAPLPVRIQRVLNRDPHRTLTDIQAIIDKQLPEVERQQRADYVIFNDDQQLVIPQVLALHQQLVTLSL